MRERCEKIGADEISNGIRNEDRANLPFLPNDSKQSAMANFNKE